MFLHQDTKTCKLISWNIWIQLDLYTLTSNEDSYFFLDFRVNFNIQIRQSSYLPSWEVTVCSTPYFLPFDRFPCHIQDIGDSLTSCHQSKDETQFNVMSGTKRHWSFKSVHWLFHTCRPYFLPSCSFLLGTGCCTYKYRSFLYTSFPPHLSIHLFQEYGCIILETMVVQWKMFAKASVIWFVDSFASS